MIRIVMVGKNKEYAQFDDYIRRCKKVEVISVKEEKANNVEVVKAKEGLRLLDSAKGYVVALSEEGILLSSQMLAELIKRNSDMSFLIGGAFGLSQEVKDDADMVLSLSRLTLPHELAHVVLAEQVYRAQKIIEGHPYHK